MWCFKIVYTTLNAMDSVLQEGKKNLGLFLIPTSIKSFKNQFFFTNKILLELSRKIFLIIYFEINFFTLLIRLQDEIVKSWPKNLAKFYQHHLSSKQDVFFYNKWVLNFIIMNFIFLSRKIKKQIK